MSIKDITACIFALVIVAGAAADRISVLPPAGSGSYHQHVRDVAGSTGADFGDWTSQECPIAAEASKLLRPNVVISRSYFNARLNQRVGFLLIQCTDVRDMISHYPPICYPYRGLSLIKTEPQSWTINGLSMPATEYQFESSRFESPDLTIVENFMILPAGQIAPNMEKVKSQLRLRGRYFGAAQVQIVFDSRTTAAMRYSLSQEFISHYQPLFDAIRSGVQ